MTTTTANPLLDFSGLPHFDQFKPEHVTPAIDELIAKASAVVARPLRTTTIRRSRAGSIGRTIGSIDASSFFVYLKPSLTP